MIPFSETGVQPYKGTLVVKPVKGIGPGSLISVANVDFTQYPIQSLGSFSYSGVYLDFSFSGGVSPLDSIRSVTIDTTSNFVNVGPVYVTAPDTGDTICCPTCTKGSFRIRTNDVKLYAFQENNGLSQVTIIACNYDQPTDSSTSELTLTQTINYAHASGIGASRQIALGDLVAGVAGINLNSTSPTTLLAAGNGNVTISEICIDGFGILNPAGTTFTQIGIKAGTTIFDLRDILAPCGDQMFANRILVPRTSVQWNYDSTSTTLQFTNSTAIRGFVDVFLTYTTHVAF